MAAPRLGASLLLRAAPRASIPPSVRQFRARPLLGAPAIKLSCPSRFYSQDAPKPSTIYFFSDMQKFSAAAPSPDRVLVDAREPAELRDTGAIPGAVNIPVGSAPDAFFIAPEEFADRFGFERPGQERELVFYCRAGVRSRAAAALARDAGWKVVGEYPGSWLDWVEKGGKGVKG